MKMKGTKVLRALAIRMRYAGYYYTHNAHAHAHR